MYSRQSTAIVISLALFLSLASLSSIFAQQDIPFLGAINADNINVRSDATVSSEIVCKLGKGEMIDVISERYDWYKIKLPSSAPSFIKKNLLSAIEDLPADSFDKNKGNPEQKTNTKAMKDNINIRLRPDETSAILGKANKNEVITILKEEGAWYKILPTNNSFGWINKKFVSKTSKIIKPTTVPMQEAKDPANLIIEGTVKPHGVIIKRIATHKLVTADNNIFLLKGDKKTLDALNYHKVKVNGKAIGPSQKQKYPVVEIVKIEELS